ncbi:MAG: nucleoside deaminase [Candidatus Cloacimonetes bacterium]|nr:nucleoside deaminase [Candidatus Cloacimonadota bacterium]
MSQIIPINHQFFMNLALSEARQAALENEIPVGAVLVKDGEVILSEHNRTKQYANPLAHAEKLIIDRIMASEPVFLYDYSLYVTLEPCLMCAGMLIWSRLGTLIWGAADPKSGVVGSVYNVLNDKSFNHHPKVISRVLEGECSHLLSSFFKEKRQ